MIVDVIDGRKFYSRLPLIASSKTVIKTTTGEEVFFSLNLKAIEQLIKDCCLPMVPPSPQVKSPAEVERVIKTINNKPCKEYSRIVENWRQVVFYLFGMESIYSDEDFKEEKCEP